ncbi:proline dehydrogenase 1, mitochondrial-like isoform X2 [Actinia tenebrosa]|nr:proline dehydrogenase 1, mitochondrial-like isoform X2 [Actinia tenebrosa]
MMEFAKKVLGKKMFKSLMKKTMYSQFVAGEDYDSIKNSVDNLKAQGIGTIMCVPTEEDYTDADTDGFESREARFDRNSEVIHDCISKTETGTFSQMRVSAICSPSVLKALNDLLQPYQTQTYKPDGLSVRNFARGLDEATPSHNLVPQLTENQNKHLKNSLRRLDSFAKHCKSKNVRLLIDAEQYYLEGGNHHLILALQSKYNTWKPWVYGTYQCYRKDTLDRLEADLEMMSDDKFHFGAKLVRGAYRQQEKIRSIELGYEYPIYDSYEETCKAYNTALEIILRQVAYSPAEVMVASHNEESIQLATSRMIELGIEKRDAGVSFAQLYGMCDQVSYLLGHKGYEVYKSVPYGPVDTTLLYLVRRALENRDVTSRTEKERFLIWKEIRQRIVGV